VITTALFIAIFQLDAYLARCSISPERFAEIKFIATLNFGEWFVKDFIKVKTHLSFTIFSIISLMSFFFSTRLFFRKYAVIKTYITGMALISGFIGVMMLFSLIFYPKEVNIDNIVILKGREICENMYNTQLYSYFLAYISWIFFLAIGYYKFKEKQV
jgi:hypothetical protein